MASACSAVGSSPSNTTLTGADRPSSSASREAGQTKRSTIHAYSLSRAARSSDRASCMVMLAGGNSAAWSIRSSSSARCSASTGQSRETRLPGTMSSLPSGQRTQALCPPS